MSEFLELVESHFLPETTVGAVGVVATGRSAEVFDPEQVQSMGDIATVTQGHSFNGDDLNQYFKKRNFSGTLVVFE